MKSHADAQTPQATPLHQAQYRLCVLVHEADARNRAGEKVTSRQLWTLAQACVEVARLQGLSWLLQDLANGVATRRACDSHPPACDLAPNINEHKNTQKYTLATEKLEGDRRER